MNIRRITKAALTTAIIAVCSLVSIPTPFGISFTLQTFAVVLAGEICGAIFGIFSVLAYIALGAVGAPIFSNFTGGFHVLVGVTGGFLFGFIPLCALSGIKTQKKFLIYLFPLLGICVCHVMGVAQFSLVAKNDFFLSFLTASLPFLLKDFISATAAVYLAQCIKKRTLI